MTEQPASDQIDTIRGTTSIISVNLEPWPHFGPHVPGPGPVPSPRCIWRNGHVAAEQAPAPRSSLWEDGGSCSDGDVMLRPREGRHSPEATQQALQQRLTLLVLRQLGWESQGAPSPSLVPGPPRGVDALSSQGPLFLTSAAPHLTLSFSQLPLPTAWEAGMIPFHRWGD